MDNNNPRYNVSDFNLSNIENNIFSCYKFPTWTKESIVKNMEYSVTIPSSQTAVAALSGGDIQVDQPAERHKGDIGVQQYQKFLQKSFTKNKNRYFENTDRIANRVINYGLSSAKPNEELDHDTGKDMFGLLVERGTTYAFDAGANMIEYNSENEKKAAETTWEVTPSPYFDKKSKNSFITSRATLYDGGKLVSLYDAYEDPKKTMWELLHSKPGSAKTQLFDLLNGISEIKLTIDGIAGIYPGDAFTSAHLPNHLLKEDNNNKLPLVFQTTNVEQEITPDGWNTTISGMPRLNHNRIYKKQEVVIKAGKDFVGDDLREFIETKNILGIGDGYVTGISMHQGIYLPLINDKYFYKDSESVGDVSLAIEPRKSPRFETKRDSVIGGNAEFLYPPKNTNNAKSARTVPFARGETSKIMQGISSALNREAEVQIFGYFNDATGGEYEKGGSMNEGHDEWNKGSVYRWPAMAYRYAKNPIAKFGPGVKVEEALWFSMYQGILFAIPPIKCRDKNIPYFTQNLSEDGTFKNMSYHLFKGLKKSKWDINRKILTPGGQCEYTDEYMEEFNDENGHKGYAPCAFTGDYRDRDLFEYTQYMNPTKNSEYGWKFRIQMDGWGKINDMNVNIWLLIIWFLIIRFLIILS